MLGTVIDNAKLQNRTQEQLNNSFQEDLIKSKISITVDESVYQDAAVTEDQPELNQHLSELNSKLESYENAEVTYEFGAVTDVLDSATIQSWVQVDNENITLDESAMRDYISGLSAKYNTQYVPRNFTTSNGNQVVIEEFRQRYLNQPYGDQTMLLRALAYKVHPYRWAAIGLATDHIAGATLADVESFYRAHYRPSNAILSISADMEEERMLELAEKWFAPLADHPSATAAIPQEPMQTQARRQEVERDVPASTVTVAYHMCARTKLDFYTADLVSDLLSGGDSGRLYTHLVKERNLLSSVNAYITGDVDPGLFVFTGQLLPGVTPEAAEAAFREEIEALQTTVATAYEIEKVKNKFEANTLFGELNVMNKAMNLGFYEMLGDLSLINREVDRYRAVTDEDIRSFSRRTLRPENSSTLIYNARK